MDSAANLLLAANAAGVAKGTTVQISGTSNSVTAADATNLAGKPNFGLSSGATLQVADTAANVVSTLDALQTMAAAAALTSIILSGSTTLTLAASTIAADAGALGKISGSFTITPTGTISAAGAVGLPSSLTAKLASGLAISDTASNVASNAAGLGALNTAGKLGSITASGALGASTAAGLSSSLVARLTAGLAVSDTASNIVASATGLVALNAAGKLLSITATGSLGAAAAAGLAGSLVARLVSGVPVSDTAANIARYAAGLVALNTAGKLASITATGSIGASDAAGVPASLFASLTAGLTVNDTALNIAGNIDALQALAGAAKLAAIAFTDAGTPSLSITYTQYTADGAALAKLSGSFALAVSGAPASAAAALQADSRVTGFSVSDTAGNVGAALDALNSASNMTSIALTDRSPLAISAAQYINDTAAIAKLAASGMTVNLVWDPSVAKAPSGFKSTVMAAIQFLSGYFSDKITININVGFGEVDGSPLGATALGESNSYLTSLPYDLMSGALSNAATTTTDVSVLAALPAGAPVSGATYWTTTAQAKALGLISPTDPSVDGSIGFSSSAPFTYGNVASIASGTYNFYAVVLHEITEVMGRQLLTGSTLGGAPKSFSLMDMLHYSAPGVLDFTQSAPGYLSPDGGVTSLGAVNTVSGADAGDWSSAVTNNAFDAFSSPGVVNAITRNDLTLLDAIGYSPDIGWTVSAASVAEAPVLQADSRVASFSISDTASAVQAAIDALNGDSKLSSISFTDTGRASVTLTYAQFKADTSALLAFAGDYALVVTGAPVSAAASLQSNAQVTSFSLTDTTQAVQSNLDALNGDMKLAAVGFTDAGTPALSMTYQQYVSDAVGHVLVPIGSPQPMVAWRPLTSTFAGSYQLVVSGVPAWAAPFLQADSRVVSFSATDTASNIQAAIDALNGDSKLSSLSFTDAGTSSLSIGYTQYITDTVALGKTNGGCSLAVSGALVSAAAALQGDGHVTAFTIADTATKVAAGLDALNGARKLSSITLCDGQPLIISTAQDQTDRAALAALAPGSVVDVVNGGTPVLTTSDNSNGPYGAAPGGTMIADALGNLYGVTSAGGDNGEGKIFALIKSGSTFTENVLYSFDRGNTAYVWSGLTADASGSLHGATVSAGPTNGGIAFALSNTGFAVASITLTDSIASVSAGLDAPGMTFLAPPSMTTLPDSSPEIVNATLSPQMGIQEIANFGYRSDLLVIALNGASAGLLKAADTTVNGVHAISLYSSADPTHGIILTGMTAGQTASDLLANHTTFTNGCAVVT